MDVGLDFSWAIVVTKTALRNGRFAKNFMFSFKGKHIIFIDAMDGGGRGPCFFLGR